MKAKKVSFDNLESLLNIIGYRGKYQFIIGILIFFSGWITLYTTQTYAFNQELPIVNIIDNDTQRLVYHGKLTYEKCNIENTTIEIDDSSIANWVTDFNIYCSKSDVSLIGTIFLLGSCIGTFANLLINIIGRKYTWILDIAIFIPFSLLLLTTNKIALFISCFFFGIGHSILVPLKTVIISENFDNVLRPLVVAFSMTVNVIIYLLGYFVFTQAYGWRVPYLVISIFALVMLILVFFLTTESPRYFLIKKKFDKLFKSINFIRLLNGKYEEEINNENFIEIIKKEENREVNLKTELSTEELLVNKVHDEQILKSQNQQEQEQSEEDHDDDDITEILSAQGENFIPLTPHGAIKKKSCNSLNLKSLENEDKENSSLSVKSVVIPFLSKNILIKVFFLVLLLSFNNYLYYATISEIRSYNKNYFLYIFGVPHLLFYGIIGWISTHLGRKPAIWICLSFAIVLDGLKIFLSFSQEAGYLLYLIKRIFIYISQAPSWTIVAESLITSHRAKGIAVVGMISLGASSLSSIIYEYFPSQIYIINVALSVLCVITLFFIEETKGKVIS